jgi:hypothetical protein
MTGYQRRCSLLPPTRRADADLERVQRCRDVVDVRAAAWATEGRQNVA